LRSKKNPAQKKRLFEFDCSAREQADIVARQAREAAKKRTKS